MNIFHNALNTLKPNALWVITGDDTYANIDWRDEEQTKPTESEVNAKVAELQAEYDAQAYARNRKAEYDQLNQFEMQFDDKRDGTTTWQDAIAKVKADYPKG